MKIVDLQRVACSGALNMVSTGRLNVDDDTKEYDRKKEHLAKLIRENVRPKGPTQVFEVLAELAPLDAERLKLIAEIFVAMRPFAPAQAKSLESSGIYLSFPDECAKADAVERTAPRSGGLADKVPRNSKTAKRILAELAKFICASSDSHRAAEDAAGNIETLLIGAPNVPSRPRRRRKRPNNVVALKPRPSQEVTGGQDGGPKAS
jgi:hypothetical protein